MRNLDQYPRVNHNSKLYFQLGLIASLIAVYFVIELKSPISEFVVESKKEVVDISETNNIDEVDEDDLEAVQKALEDIKAKKNPSAEPAKPKDKIEFIITNPDDVDMDGEGQTKLF